MYSDPFGGVRSQYVDVDFATETLFLTAVDGSQRQCTGRGNSWVFKCRNNLCVGSEDPGNRITLLPGGKVVVSTAGETVRYECQ